MRIRTAHALVLVLLAGSALGAQAPSDRGAAALAEAVQGLGTSARVLVIGAHPDDEDTRLIAWLARGRHVETAYLSLTRGEGGQNLIGNELGEALGALRTEELLAARRVDGAHQYFTRAVDYGFSKSADEAFQHWPREEILKDVVTVVRAFRPHVIIAIFTGTPDDGHGQHQASGILAREAYDAAADTARFPSRLTAGLPGWAPLKFYRARSYRNHEGATYAYDPGEYDPLAGRSYAELAAISRSQHRSQAMGSLEPKGPMRGSLRREASRVNESTPAAQEKGVFDGIDTTWSRLRGAGLTATGREALGRVNELVAGIRKQYDPFTPSEVAAMLTVLTTQLSLVCGEQPSCSTAAPAALDAQRSVNDGMRRAARALRLASGMDLEATVPRELVPVGWFQRTALAVYNRGRDSGVVARRSVTASRTEHGRVERDADEPPLPAGGVYRDTLALRAAELTQPWWLASPRVGDLYGVPVDTLAEDERVLGGASALADVRINGSEAYDGAPVRLEEEVVHRFADPARGEIRRPVAVVPAVSVTLDRAAEIAQANTPLDRTVRVTLRSADTASREVTVSVDLPRGLTADATSRVVTLPRYDAMQTVEFRLRGQLPPGRHVIRASAESGGQRFTQGYTLIDYEHVRPQRMFRDATLDIEAVDLKLPRRLHVAYLRGVGDNTPPILQQLGVDLVELDPARLPAEDLARYSVVVVGPRAYEANPELVQHNARLLDWVSRGGTMVVQYGQTEMQRPGIMPYAITLARPADRVTDESSPITVVDRSSPLLAYPNRITDADWKGWVQDRTLYMPRTFDEHWRAPIATSDPGEQPNRGAILVAPYGKGTYVYTTLAFFRQLPAGVPGAARLFANLLAAGESGAARAPAAPATP
ncbi:MAG: PIG-L family deacetylase [Gemmatimonadaceae bacterium]